MSSARNAGRLPATPRQSRIGFLVAIALVAGFLLHIPCPPPEILIALPNHERLIPSLCEYDLVGFQTCDDAFNFSRYLTRECGLHSRDFNFVIAGRTIRIDEFIDALEAVISRALRLACDVAISASQGIEEPVITAAASTALCSITTKIIRESGTLIHQTLAEIHGF